jgi:Uma2 family endonuclease
MATKPRPLVAHGHEDAMSRTTLITADELLRMPDDGCRYELVEGEICKMTPAGWRHGGVVSYVDRLIGAFVEQHGLGRVLAGDPGFLLARDPDTVRAPDVAFVRRERQAEADPAGGFWPGAPDLAVEVVSPGDRFIEVDEKARMWLGAGAAAVWVVNPQWRTVTVYRPGAEPSAPDVRTLTENDELDGGDVLPGFRCPVGEIFAV